MFIKEVNAEYMFISIPPHDYLALFLHLNLLFYIFFSLQSGSRLSCTLHQSLVCNHISSSIFALLEVLFVLTDCKVFSSVTIKLSIIDVFFLKKYEVVKY